MIKRGPAEGASWDKSGQPTQALLGFIKSCGVTLADLTLSHTEKGSWYSVEIKNQARPPRCCCLSCSTGLRRVAYC